VVGLLVMLGVDALLVRRPIRPLERLAERMETADVLGGHERVPAISGGEIGTLERTFNAMMDRLETERREAGARELQGREEERRRLARGLHDEVGQSMTVVLLKLKSLAAGASPQQRALIAEAQEVVRTSLDDVRRLAHELRPEALDHLGLGSALANLASCFERDAHVHVEQRIRRDLPRLEPGVELVVYRVAQESLTNVARHADASEVLVSLEPRNGSVVLRVADNGRGLVPGTAQGGGLRGIREQALIAGGTVTVADRREGGVEVQLEVPAERS